MFTILQNKTNIGIIKINVSFCVLIKSERNPIIFLKISTTNLYYSGSEFRIAQYRPKYITLKLNLNLNRNMDKTGKNRGIIDSRYLD